LWAVSLKVFVSRKTRNTFLFFYCCGELNPEGCKSNLDTTYKNTGRSKIRFTETVNLTLITFTCVRFPFATFGNILISLALVSISSFVTDKPLIVGCS